MNRLLTLLTVTVLTTTASASPINSLAVNTFGTAQDVTSGFAPGADPIIFNSTTQPHVEISRGTGLGDGYHFYRFTTTSAGTITLDIDASPTTVTFDTEVFLFDAIGNNIGGNDDNGSDPGSNSALNSLFTSGVLPAGDYIAAVGRFNSFFTGIGTIGGSTVSDGDTFTLNISAEVSAIPEPATLAVFGGIAVAGALGYRRRKATATV